MRGHRPGNSFHKLREHLRIPADALQVQPRKERAQGGPGKPYSPKHPLRGRCILAYHGHAPIGVSVDPHGLVVLSLLRDQQDQGGLGMSHLRGIDEARDRPAGEQHVTGGDELIILSAGLQQGTDRRQRSHALRLNELPQEPTITLQRARNLIVSSAHGGDHSSDPDIVSFSQNVVDQRAASHMDEGLRNRDAACDQALTHTSGHQPKHLETHSNLRLNELQGVHVIRGSASGTARLWDRGSTYTSHDIIIAPYLSISLAQAAVRGHVAAVATAAGGFACHGANILRMARSDVAWITDVSGLDDIREGEELSIDNGCVTRGAPRETGDTLPPSWPGWRPKEVAIWDVALGDKVQRRCYWPHRQYDRLTRSVMQRGLEKSASELAGHPCQVEADEDGRLWFIGAESSLRYAEAAADPVQSTGLLSQQLHVYEGILKTLDISAADVHGELTRLHALITSYFSVHLLFHDTYEAALWKLRQSLKHQESASTRTVYDALLTPRILTWTMENEELHTSKDLLREATPFSMPGGLPVGQGQEHARMVLQLADSLALSLTTDQRVLVAHCARVCVAKEWKFVLNKLLYSRFGHACAQISVQSRIPVDDLRSLDFSQLAAIAIAASQGDQE